MTKVRVYCASPAHRARMWRKDLIPATFGGAITITSTWHDNEHLADHEGIAALCATAWEQNFKEIRQSDALLAYAEHKDRPNGTLVEIGYAIAMELPVFIVGNFAWGSWLHHPSVTFWPTLRDAIEAIGDLSNVETH